MYWNTWAVLEPEHRDSTGDNLCQSCWSVNMSKMVTCMQCAAYVIHSRPFQGSSSDNPVNTRACGLSGNSHSFECADVNFILLYD
ncbi:hypothetical protein I7I50_10098 [Histoplasma capsulatum G186AR]|uniref:RanBP2-type domain-containing protein n=1 Tax=Ajellomyces capsulatus TaxID=5037 RepID=A0A8H7Z3A6_AJECA|nr:hypothetical protein I7I52_01336 [Histoplasma capsulatum]QSS68952.1 hypothetical protein I7I50_10098 [Histoplasma capsulatum G186AR]